MLGHLTPEAEACPGVVGGDPANLQPNITHAAISATIPEDILPVIRHKIAKAGGKTESTSLRNPINAKTDRLL